MSVGLSFAFDPSKGETPETLKRKRRLTEAMLASMSSPKDVGSGLTALGQAIAFRMLNSQIGAGEDASAKRGAALFSGAIDGGGAFPAAPSSKVVSALLGKEKPKSPQDEASIDFARTDDANSSNRTAPGVGDDYFSAIRSAESGGNDTAKNPRSSATGRYQFISSTWNKLAQDHPDLGLTPDGRSDPAQQERAIHAFTADNASTLQGAGIPINGGNLYAAHFLGADGAKRVLSANPGASVSALVGDQVVRANPFLNGMTVADFQRWTAKKGGSGAVDLGGTRVASLDPSAGMGQPSNTSTDPYARIPATDGMGQDQRAKFRKWNNDPAANEAGGLSKVDPALSKVIERAKQIAGTNFVLGSGRRDPEQQKIAMANGWSGTMDSDHLGGGAADLWPVDENGAVVFDPQKQSQIVSAMQQAGKEFGVDLDVGANWKNPDRPHFAIANQTPLDNAPIPTPRPGNGQVASLDPSIGMPPAQGQPAPQQTAGLFVGTPEELAAQRGQGAQQPPQVPAQMLDPRMSGAQGGFVPPQAPQAAPQPQQVAQASDPDLALFGAQSTNAGEQQQLQLRRLRQAYGSPDLSDEQRGMVAGEIKRIEDASDPLNQMQLEKGRLELDALKNPRPDYDFVNGRDGAVFRVDKRDGSMTQVYGGKIEQPADVKEYEYYRDNEINAGREPLGPLEYQQALRKSGADSTQVNIDQKAEGAFEKKAAEKQAEAFDAMATDGLTSRADLGIINELDTLLKGQGGALTGLAGIAAKNGIPVEGADDLQAAQALINKLIPTQRQPGSGSMSDRDVEMFTRSLPSLWNQPGGNAKIIGVMRGLAGYKQQQGEIADQVLNGEITRQEGRRALRALPNPLADIEGATKGRNKQPTVIDGYTIEQVD